LLKFRNEADSAWIDLAYMNQTTSEWEIRSGVVQAVDSGGILFKTDEGTTRVTLDDSGNLLPLDASVSLGGASNRFSDGYFSGGVYLGGTGSANKLEDYEEGTWTPAVSATSSAPSSISYSERTGIYTKIGNLVTLQCELLISSKSGGSGGATITGMPFACKSVDIVPVGSMEASFINLSTGYSMFAVMTYQSQSAIFLRQHGDSVAESSISIGSVGSSSRMRFTLTYQTQ